MIIKIPRYVDAYLYRGKLFLKVKQFERAIRDFDVALRINPHKMMAYIYKGDCYRCMQKYGKALKMFSFVIDRSGKHVITG